MKVTLTVDDIKKKDANTIIKAIKKLAELGQIEEANFHMVDDQGIEV
tara:strand:- start:152 stop:292 length:141 start_codon:yes stop_codon:yes gene_type:complete